MYNDALDSVIQAGKKKIKFLDENPLGFILSSILAGVFVGFGILLIFSISAVTQGLNFTKILMGMSFGVALSLVIMAGSELFTGNNFVMGVGLFRKEIRIRQVIKLWLVCYIGNWIGSWILAFLFSHSGLMTENLNQVVANASLAKTQVPFVGLLIRGMLCNVLVCIAVWLSIKMKSESGKLIMIFWCLFAFITTGFEHSVANMTLLSLDILQPVSSISISGYFYNILTASLGNMIGGIFFVALPYVIVGKERV